MATSAALAYAPPAGTYLEETAMPVGVDQLVLPDALAWDGTDYLGTEGSYTVWEVDSGGLATAEAVTIAAPVVAPTGTAVFGTPVVTDTTAQIPVTYTEGDETSLEYSLDAGVTWTTFTSPISLTLLDAATEYTIQARARNSAGTGPIASTTFTTEPAIVPSTASVTVAYGPGASRNYAIVELPLTSPQLFDTWSRDPLAGEQLVAQNSAGQWTPTGDFQTQVEGIFPVHLIADDGIAYYLTIDSTGLEGTAATTPSDFQFTAQNNVARDFVVTSNSITVQGVDAGIDIPLTVTGGEYSISTNSGESWDNWASTATVVQLNHRVRLRHTSASTYSGETETTVTIGGRSRSFVSTTLADTVAPVISLVGGNQTIVQGTPWVEPGYTVTDNSGENLLLDVVVTGTVNVNVIDQYTLTYTVADSAGNVASTTRNVNVVAFVPDDQVAPVISLIGGNRVLQVGEAWVEPGFTATDNVDGDVTAQVVVTGTVNTAQAGTYTLTYRVSDQAGNEAVTTRVVTVLPATLYPLTQPAPVRRTYIGRRVHRVEVGEPAMVKHPEEILDYDFDLTEWLEQQNDTLSGDVLVTVPEGLEIVGQGAVTGLDRVKVWLSGGDKHYSYPVTLTVTTAGSRRAVFQFRLVIVDRMGS